MSTGQHGATPQLTRDPRLREGWRAAAAAYRRAYGELSGKDPHRGCAHEAMTEAIAALHAVVPDLTEREAMLEAIAAVSYASAHHSKWLYALYQSPPRRS